jgi:hypothetical protein
MGGSFACPECGNPVALSGPTPGRQVCCDWCRTWVEVPFLPRLAGRWRGESARNRGWRKRFAWAWGGLAVLALLLTAAGAGRMLQSRSRQVHTEALCRLSDDAQLDEREGRLGGALATVEAALIEAARIEPGQSARLDELRGWRDRLARREMESRLAELPRLDPQEAIGLCLTLQARINGNPSLAGFEESVVGQLERARMRSVEADLSSARQALEAGDATRVLELCERLVETANTLPTETRRRARCDADRMVAEVVSRRGLILAEIDGEFTLGSRSAYVPVLQPMLADALRLHGYVPRPNSSYWASLWDRLAPYHLGVAILETQPGPYLQTSNRTSFLEVKMSLEHRGKKLPVWGGPVTASTRLQIPNLSAYQASRIAVGVQRDPAFERLFYDDAWSVLIDRLAQRLRSLPDIRGPLAIPSSSSPADPS